MALSRDQVRNIARKTRQARAAKKRLDAAPSPAQEKDHQKIAQGLMQRRRARQEGRL